MKKILFVCAALIAAASAPAQFVVVAETPDLNTITLQNHLEEILKLGVMIEEARTTKNWLGNAADVLDIAGARELLQNLQTVGVGQSRAALATVATSLDALTYNDTDLYRPPGDSFVTRDGRLVARADDFKPEAAVFGAVRDYDAVQEDVAPRRESLRAGIQQTLTQLQAATTHSAVQKGIGVLLAQQAELEATDRELTFAAQKAVLLDLQNRAERDRQEKAGRQEQAQEFTEALRHLGAALRPPAFTQPARTTTTARP